MATCNSVEDMTRKYTETNVNTYLPYLIHTVFNKPLYCYVFKKFYNFIICICKMFRILCMYWEPVSAIYYIIHLKELPFSDVILCLIYLTINKRIHILEILGSKCQTTEKFMRFSGVGF